MRRPLPGLLAALAISLSPTGCSLAGPAAAAGASGERGSSHRVVAAYLPDYRLPAFRPEMADGLTDLILFSVQPGNDGHVRDDHALLANLETIEEVRRRGRCRILLSVGGGGMHRSDGFSAAASDAALRARLVSELLALTRRHGFDGLDVDWEHMQGARDAQAFAALVGDLKRALEPHRLLLTAAAGDLDLLYPEAVRSLDRIHLMTYDGPQHGTLAQAKTRVWQALARGIPAHKLCVGIPLYARGASPGRELPWAKLVARFRPPRGADEIDGYRFSGVETTREKARFVREQNLGGIMFWELLQDAADASLIRSAREALNERPDGATLNEPAVETGTPSGGQPWNRSGGR